MISNQKIRILELDALRGIAAIMVVMFHLTMGTAHQNAFFCFGQSGVDLFFMISGFVILMTIEKVSNAKEFIISRITRLYPTYWFCVAFTAILLVVHDSQILDVHFVLRCLANLTMFQAYLLQKDIDGPYWTMLIEMLFYIYMVVIYLSNKLYKVEVVSSLLLVPALFFGVYLCSRYPSLKLDMRFYRVMGLVNFFPLFLSGIIYYNLKFKNSSNWHYALLVICYLTQLSLFHTVNFRTQFLSIYQYAAALATYNLLFVLFVNNKLKFIVNPVTIFLGNISYPLYLIHQHFSVVVLMPFLTRYLNFGAAGFVAVIGAIILAYFVHLFIEKPSLKYARNKWLKRQAKPKDDLNQLVSI